MQAKIPVWSFRKMSGSDWCLQPRFHTATHVKCQLRVPRDDPETQRLSALCTAVKAGSALRGQALKKNRWMLETRCKGKPGEHSERYPCVCEQRAKASSPVSVSSSFLYWQYWGPNSGSEYAGQTCWPRAIAPVFRFLCKCPDHMLSRRTHSWLKLFLKVIFKTNNFTSNDTISVKW